MPINALPIEQIERRLKKLRDIAKDTHVRAGWINYMRRAMFLTLDTLAKRAKLSPSTIQQIEKRETEGRVTIETMRKIASAMECEFIYAIVPKQTLTEYLEGQAIAKARQIVRNADVHMTLEDQKVSEDIQERIKRVAKALLDKGDIW